MTTETQKIHRQMTIESILGMFPQKAQKLAAELTNTGLHCVGCGAATWETLEAGMFGHGMNDTQIDNLVERLNKLLDEPVSLDTITLTPAAASKYCEILEANEKLGWGLRLSEQAAGCSGYEYILDFSEKALPSDAIFESQGVQIHVDKRMVPHLLGAEIDFIDSLQNGGFKVSNPNARSSCGCGSSHGY